MSAETTLQNLQNAGSGNLPTTAPMAAHNSAMVTPGFNSAAGWDLMQRMSKAFAASDLVPQNYRGNLANCIVAMEMSTRMGASPLQVMQNLYIVHGNPGWSSKFLIACFNQSGKFSAMRYTFDRDTKGKATGCRAWSIEKATGEKLEGATITIEMANAEGWSTKSGSKWKTMPEQMLMYRAAAFFVRTYAPEISMGLQTEDELRDGIYEAPAGTVTTVAELQPAPQAAQVITTDGEILTPAQAAQSQAPAGLDAYRARLKNADGDVAALVLDDARTSLPPADYQVLCDEYEASLKG
jgi:hypothetical protein